MIKNRILLERYWIDSIKNSMIYKDYKLKYKNLEQSNKYEVSYLTPGIFISIYLTEKYKHQIESITEDNKKDFYKFESKLSEAQKKQALLTISLPTALYNAIEKDAHLEFRSFRNQVKFSLLNLLINLNKS